MKWDSGRGGHGRDLGATFRDLKDDGADEVRPVGWECSGVDSSSV